MMRCRFSAAISVPPLEEDRIGRVIDAADALGRQADGGLDVALGGFRNGNHAAGPRQARAGNDTAAIACAGRTPRPGNSRFAMSWMVTT